MRRQVIEKKNIYFGYALVSHERDLKILTRQQQLLQIELTW